MGGVALAVGTVCGRRGRTKPDCRHLGLIINQRLHPERIHASVVNGFARNKLASMAMIAMTTKSSISVNPLTLCFR